MPPRRSASGPMTASNAQPQPQSTASTSLASLPPPIPPSPIVAKLRKMWQFAVVCQFMHTFDEAFGMSGFETESLERDLDEEETAFIPDLMRRLLYTLTLDRRVSIENWQDKTRNQYLKREPQNNPFGTFEEPRSWEEMSLTQKVEVLRAACEWHFQDSERFRKLVKSDEDAESWRIEPIGWDRKGNTYWLFDDNRLWIQYAPPPEPEPERPPASRGSKRARADARRAAAAAKKAGNFNRAKAGRKPKSSSKNRFVSKSSSPSLKRSRSDAAQGDEDDDEEEDDYEDLLEDEDEDDDSGRSKKRLRTRASKAAPLPRRNASRSAAADATRNIKRNAIENAAALADLQSGRSGTRTSRRLKGGDDDDGEWESIPDELLRERNSDDENENEDENGEEDGDDARDDDSLSEPPSGAEDRGEGNEGGSQEEEDSEQDSEMEDDENQEQEEEEKETKEEGASIDVDVNGVSAMLEKDHNTNGKIGADQENKGGDQMDLDQVKSEHSDVTAEEKKKEEEDKVEFETVAVTLQEWDSIIDSFSKSKHPDEKNLYNFLKEEVYPKVTKELIELEKARAQEILLASRKRSSRIAIKESEKEERERDRIARLSMEERMSGVRAEEESKVSKGDLAKQRELERERKIKEREERALAREREAEEKARLEEMERIRKEHERTERQRRRDELIANGDDPSAMTMSPEPSSSSAPAPPAASPAAASSTSHPAASKPKRKGRPSAASSKQPGQKNPKSKAKEVEDWVLSCEVCGLRGKNLQESAQIVCCEQCGVWQHVKCWNNQDKRNGAETLRKWSETDFYCSKCRKPEDPNLMPPYPNSKPLPSGFVLQKLKRPPKSRNSGASKDEKKEEKGKGKDEEKSGTPKEKKPRAPRKSKDSNAAIVPNASTPGQAAGQAQAHIPIHPQSPAGQALAPSQADAQSVTNPQPQPNGHTIGSVTAPPSQTPMQVEPRQQLPPVQLPPGNLALGSLPPPPALNGLGNAFVHQQPPQRSPSLNGLPHSSPSASGPNQTSSILSPRSPSGLPRSNQPSGSFPIRRDAPARSPLSRPYDSPTEIPPLTIGRAQSPTMGLSHSRNGSGTTMTPLQRGVAASSNPNPTFSPGNGNQPSVDRNPLYQRQAAAPSPSMTKSEGPGPMSGAIRPRMPSDPTKQFGPSPPRQLYGSSDHSASTSSPPSNGNGNMAPPSSRPFQQPSSNLSNPTVPPQNSVPVQPPTSSTQAPQTDNQRSGST